MKVAELIAFLQTQPQDLQVVVRAYSEYLLVEKEDIKIKPLCPSRSDGWVHDARPDKPTQDYLAFPGN